MALGFGEEVVVGVVAGAAHAVSSSAIEVRVARIDVRPTSVLMSFTLTVPCRVVVAKLSQNRDGRYLRYRPNHSMIASKR